ncbi:MAG: metallophosphoesterase [Bacteroidales bacterium]|nr:metallophosphoesterase [Bacteroidales bacterium]
MISCFFVSDLHGHTDRYEKLFGAILENKPQIVFFGGDLLPHGMRRNLTDDFTRDFLIDRLLDIRSRMGSCYPRIYIILGNDDPRSEEKAFLNPEPEGLWFYLHNRKDTCFGYTFYGYSNVPPTPFRFKDWERYDVSRYVDPGCIPPMEGFRTVEPEVDLEFATIKDEIAMLIADDPMEKAILLAHSPPYKSYLDRAALDGKMVDHVPMDVHVGSIAIMRYIEERQPWLTLHGHIHESSRITGHWMQQFGRTVSFNGSWDGPELALIEFDLDKPSKAVRHLL